MRFVCVSTCSRGATCVTELLTGCATVALVCCHIRFRWPFCRSSCVVSPPPPLHCVNLFNLFFFFFCSKSFFQRKKKILPKKKNLSGVCRPCRAATNITSPRRAASSQTNPAFREDFSFLFFSPFRQVPAKYSEVKINI